MTNKNRFQRGMTTIQIMLVVGVIAIFAMVGMKLVPIYLDYKVISEISDEVHANTSLMQRPRSKVLEQLNTSFRMNNLWDYTAEDTIRLEKDAAKGYKLTVDYEKRTNLIANIDLVTVFNRQAGTQ